MIGRPSALIMIIPAQPPRIVASPKAGSRAVSALRHIATNSGSTPSSKLSGSACPTPSSTPISVAASPSGRNHEWWIASMTTQCRVRKPAGQRKIEIWIRWGARPKSSSRGASRGAAHAPGTSTTTGASTGPPGGLDPADTTPRGHNPRDLAAGLDRRPEASSRLGEGERGRVRVGESRLGLPGGGADVVDPGPRKEVAQPVPGDHLRGDAEALLPRDVSGEHRLVTRGDDLDEADGLEAAVAADDIPEIPEDLEAFEREPGLGLIGVVHAHQRAGLARGTRAEVAPLEQQDVLHPPARQVKRGARAVGPAADDDHLRPPHARHAFRLPQGIC